MRHPLIAWTLSAAIASPFAAAAAAEQPAELTVDERMTEFFEREL